MIVGIENKFNIKVLKVRYLFQISRSFKRTFLLTKFTVLNHDGLQMRELGQSISFKMLEMGMLMKIKLLQMRLSQKITKIRA